MGAVCFYRRPSGIEFICFAHVFLLPWWALVVLVVARPGGRAMEWI
jgi:hypothetical protein